MLFLRGLGWRRGFSAAVLVVGLISAAVAGIGPLYARAASESTLTDELRSGGSDAGLAFTASVDAGDPRGLSSTLSQIGAAAHVPGYGTAITGESALVTARSPSDAASSPSTLVTRSGQCRHLEIVTGHCPSAVGDLLVPQAASTGAPHWRIGQTLDVKQRLLDPLTGVGDGLPITSGRIVGTYRPRDFTEAYWFDQPYFQSALGPGVRSALTNLGVDAVFTVPGTFLGPVGAQSGSTGVQKQIDVDVPLRATAVRLDDVARLRRDVAAVARAFPKTSDSESTPAMRTSLPRVLDDAARDKRQVQTATLVVVLELSALSLLVLFQVVGGAVEARGDEIALAKLRGLRPSRTVVFALGEPLALLVVAAPLGFLAALGLTRALAATALVGGTPVAVTPATGWALLAAFAGGAAAAVLAAVRTVTRPVLEQWRNTAPARHGTRWLLAIELGLAAAAAATVVALRTGDSSSPNSVFLLAPGLIVFAVALVGVRLLPLLARLGLRPTRASGRIALFLALRQTVRRPGGLRLAVLLAVSVGLATFAICGEAVAAANRDARAQTEIGTAQRVTVEFAADHDPQTIVGRVDPHADWATAAAAWVADGGPANGHTITGPLLGVSPERLSAAAYRVRGQLTPAALARDIVSPGVVPRATFTGTRLVVDLQTTALSGDRPTLEVQVRRGNAQPAPVSLGVLTPGRTQYAAAVDCTAGCTFAGLVVDLSVDAAPTVTGSLVLHSVATSAGPIAGLQVRRAAGWRSSAVGYGAGVTPTATPAGLQVTFSSTGGGSPVLVHADAPTTLPVVAAPEATTTGAATGGVVDYSGAQAGYRIVRRTSPLPVVLDTGAIANLTYLRELLPNFDREATWQVWIGPHAPSDALARLRHAGLLVQHVDTESSRSAQLGRQGPALGLLLLLVCAIAAAVLAVGGTAITLLADARRRMFEMAALRVVGVRQSTLRRSAVAEQALLLGAALVLGLPSGYAAAALVLPVVPEFSDPTPVVLRYSPPVLLALLCALGFAVLLGVTALVAGRALARAAVPSRLRGSGR